MNIRKFGFLKKHSKIETDARPTNLTKENGRVDQLFNDQPEINVNRRPNPETSNTNNSTNIINIIGCTAVHLGPEYTFNIRAPKNDEEKSEDIKPTEEIMAVMDSTDEITFEYRDIVSKNLGKGWRDVFRKMGMEDPVIETCYESEQHKGTGEVIYQLLLNWTREANRTLGELCKILWDQKKYTLVTKLGAFYAESAAELKPM